MARRPERETGQRRGARSAENAGLATKRDFLSMADYRTAEIAEILALARQIKQHLREGRRPPLLAGKTLAMIFQKPSLRTRVTFEVGMTQLGGSAIYLDPSDIRPGERESVADIATNLARWVDVIVARTYEHELLLELARSARVPVVNGLTDLLHPCQVLADCLTLEEHRGTLAGTHVAFVGDGNNVAHSWLHAAARLDLRLTLACPAGYEPQRRIVQWAQRSARRKITITHDADAAVRDADVIYTDVWASMGQERDAAIRRRAFRKYQVNERLVGLARPAVLVMHCLPAHRGEEITDAVIDGPRSIVLDQAENRLHAEKGLLVWLLAQTRPGRKGPTRARGQATGPRSVHRR